MPDNSYGKTTVSEKVQVVLSNIEALIKAFWALLRYPFASSTKVQPTLIKEVSRTITRLLLDRCNAAQTHWVLMASTAAYKNWIATRAKKEGAPAQVATEMIGEGAKIHWIGSQDAEKVLLHYHGGGFVQPLHKGHMSLVNQFRCEIKRRSGVEVKIAFLEYSLSPHFTYPTQFRQAIAALKHVLDSGISPSNIVISGDSAGGLLATQVISHLLHPHPGISPLPIPTNPLAGIMAISPWVRFESDAPSFVYNDKDILSDIPLLYWGRLIRQNSALSDGKGEPDGYWSEPLTAPPEWWRGAEKVTKHILITYGDWEAFKDDNLAFAEKLKKGVADSKVEVAVEAEPRGIHIGPVVDAYAGRARSDIAKEMARWVYERLT